MVQQPPTQMRSPERQALGSLLPLAAPGVAVEINAMPAPITVTRDGLTYTLRFISRVNASWFWAEDQFGERWRVAY